jgi:hypothetical protein
MQRRVRLLSRSLPRPNMSFSLRLTSSLHTPIDPFFSNLHRRRRDILRRPGAPSRSSARLLGASCLARSGPPVFAPVWPRTCSPAGWASASGGPAGARRGGHRPAHGCAHGTHAAQVPRRRCGFRSGLFVAGCRRRACDSSAPVSAVDHVCGLLRTGTRAAGPG